MATSGKPPGWRQGTLGELVSEFLGTAIIILFGCGSVAMSVAALNQSDRGPEAFQASGDWLLITTGWGIGVALAVWVAGGVSGAHLNPAVTLAHALRRGFPWSKVPSYWARRCSAPSRAPRSSTSTTTTRSRASRPPRRSPAARPTRSRRSRSSPPSPRPTSRRRWGPLIDQIIGTGLLVLVIFAVIDAFNTPVKANLAPLVVGLIVVGHRRLVRRQRRLRDQPGPRPRPAPAGLGRGLEVGRDTRRLREGQLLHVGPDRGPAGRRRAGRLPVRLRGPRRADRARRRARPRDRGGGGDRHRRARRSSRKHEQVRRRHRSGHHQLALHPLRQGRRDRPRRPARARADQPEGRLGRARRDRDLAPHAPGHQRRDGRLRRRGRRHRGDRHHQPARDRGGVGPGDGRADPQRDRVAGHAHRRARSRARR